MGFELHGQIGIASPQGRLGFAEAALAQQALQQAIAGVGPLVRGLVIDGRALRSIASAGLRVWLLSARAARAAGLVFGICSLQDPVAEVFASSGLNLLIPTYAERAAAWAACQLAAAD